MIKNLNQLRRTLREGTQLEILDHCRPECIGQIRNITLVNTQGFYSTVANQPDASDNRGNGGRGHAGCGGGIQIVSNWVFMSSCHRSHDINTCGWCLQEKVCICLWLHFSNFFGN